MGKKGSNPLPPEVYNYMIQFAPRDGGEYDLHHSIIDRGNVSGMEISERSKIHHPFNLWWLPSQDHASHANIPTKRELYKLLCNRWGKNNVDDYIRSFNWKSTPPVTVEWLESEE